MEYFSCILDFRWTVSQHKYTVLCFKKLDVRTFSKVELEHDYIRFSVTLGGNLSALHSLPESLRSILFWVKREYNSSDFISFLHKWVSIWIVCSCNLAQEEKRVIMRKKRKGKKRILICHGSRFKGSQMNFWWTPLHQCHCTRLLIQTP